MQAIIATVALLAGAALADVGSAVVVNKCNYDVHLANTPSADGGYTEIDKVLSTDDTYEQTWTELTNSNGWSIKLSNSSSLANILQYEYTFHDDGIIWYDLSEVNGNPWDGNWEITASSASSTCTPKQQAYRYATDDAYGMQACPQDSVITVTLCSGEDQDDGGAASASSSVAAETSTAASSFSTPSSSVQGFSSAAASTTQAQASSTEASSYASSTPTTFATAITSVATSSVVTTDAGGVTVTQVDTAVVTDIATSTHWGHGHHWSRRHAHA